jgi:hypothetical protein
MRATTPVQIVPKSARSFSKLRRRWKSFQFRRKALLSLTTVAGLAMLVFVAGCPPPPGPPPAVPTDAQDACPLSATTFAGWFQSGSVSLNGVVNPANSLINLNPDCDFYAWSNQMFMWLTSPAPSAYGGGAHIFDSPAFFDVSPPDANGNRTFLAHTAGLIRPFPLRATQRGPHGLPVRRTIGGQLVEVKPPDAKLPALVRDASGKTVEIAHVRVENGRTLLLDKEGKVIGAQHIGIVIPTEQNRVSGNVVQEFIVDRFPIFLDPTLAVIDVEQNQADFNVLEAQQPANGSLVYFATMVNDVYAYFLTGVKDGAITTTTPNEFPTTGTDLNNIIAFATAHGKPNPPFPDPNALAIEVKSSWVLAAGLPNLSSYITMNATIPTYDQTTNKFDWKPTGEQTVQLALVGMHVVGSTANHPEMVWATFEHIGNTPLGTYSYTANNGNTQTVSQSTAGTWLFSASGSAGPFNQPHMNFAGPPGNDILGACVPNAPPGCIPGSGTNNFQVSPSDTLRTEPWGIDGTNTFSNTEVISMDSHVQAMIASGDIRANYVMTGATWTPFGSPPSGGIPGVGTNRLANSTMETYQQGTSNCFTCHQNGLNPNGLSHVYGGLKPLF